MEEKKQIELVLETDTQENESACQFVCQSLGKDIRAYIRIAFTVFMRMALLVVGGELLILLVPAAIFLQGIVFAFHGIAAWTCTINAGILFAIAVLHRESPAARAAFSMLALASVEWLLFALPYPTYRAADKSSVFELFVALFLVIPTWRGYFLLFRIVYRKMRAVKA